MHESFHAAFLSRWSGSKPFLQAFMDHTKNQIVVRKCRAWRLVLMPPTGRGVDVKRSVGSRAGELK